jgi:hypothetical protein
MRLTAKEWSGVYRCFAKPEVDDGNVDTVIDTPLVYSHEPRILDSQYLVKTSAVQELDTRNLELTLVFIQNPSAYARIVKKFHEVYPLRQEPPRLYGFNRRGVWMGSRNLTGQGGIETSKGDSACHFLVSPSSELNSVKNRLIKAPRSLVERGFVGELGKHEGHEIWP